MDREVELAAVSFFSFFQFFSYKPGGFLREWGFVKGEVYFQMLLSALKSDEPQFFAPHDEDEGVIIYYYEENGDGNGRVAMETSEFQFLSLTVHNFRTA